MLGVINVVDSVKSVNSVDNLSSVNSVHSVHNVQMAHPNMEDANVAPLNRPDDDFPSKNTIIIMSKNMGWPVSGPKPTKMGIEDWDPDATGPPSSNKGFPGPKRTKTNGVRWGGPMALGTAYGPDLSGRWCGHKAS